MLKRAVILAAVVLAIAATGCRRPPVPVADDSDTVKSEEPTQGDAESQTKQGVDADIQTE